MREESQDPPLHKGAIVVTPGTQAVITITFNDDGTVDPADLVGLDPEFVARITSPEFVADAARRIQLQKAKDLLAAKTEARRLQTGRKALKRNDPLMGRFVESADVPSDPVRRPASVSGRQRKRLRRAARKWAKAVL